MLAAVLTAPDDLAPRELPRPSPGLGEVLVRVGANTLCGTDLRIMTGQKTGGVRLPVVLGHETAGRVAEVGPGVRGYEEGDAVAMCPAIPCLRCWECRHDLENMCANQRIMGYAVNGGLAEWMVVPAEAVRAGCLFVSRGDLPMEALALAEPLACVVLGQRWVGVRPDDAVLIMGAGPIGLLHLQLALLAGAREVIVSQPSPTRRARAVRLGATRAVDPGAEDLSAVVAEHTEGRGVDVSILCVGRPELVNQAIRLTRKGGGVSLFAGLGGEGWAEVEANLIHYRQVRVSGTSNARRADYETAVRLLEAGRIDGAGLVTHRFGLPDVAEAIGMVGHPDALKVAVLP